MARKEVLAGACRTAIGKMGGALSNTPAADLGAIVIKEALRRAGVKPEMVDEVKMGCVIQAAQGQNVARQASIKAGLPIEVPAITINVVCGSGLKCVNDAATMIMAGEADIVVAGGMENMSMAPYAMTKARFGYRMNNATIIDTMVNDALTDAFNHYHMMITAENVCDKYGITREELDEFSANSQQKCEKAIAEGKFADEIVPVPVKVKKEIVDFVTDEGPRAGTTAESLAKLKCCSGKEGGLVTAGNASGINDGAAAIVVMSEEKAKELGVTPMATWVAGALGGVEPEIMGVGPVASTKKVLASTVSSGVFTPAITSINFIRSAGLKKCIPTIGRVRPFPISVMERLDVFEAKIHSGFAILSNSWNVVFFTPISSNAASTIRSQSAQRSSFNPGVILARIASTASCVIFPFSTSLA